MTKFDVFLIKIGILIALSIIISNTLVYNMVRGEEVPDYINNNKINNTILKNYEISVPIHINGNSEWINTYKALNGRKIYYSEKKAEDAPVESYNKQSIIGKPPLTGTQRDVYGLSKSHITLIKTCYSGRLVVCYKIKNDGKVSLSLYDHRGKVRKEKVQVVEGRKIQETSFCTEALKNGIYFISLRTSVDRQVVALVHLQ